MKPLILVVDDCEVYLEMVASSLEDKYKVITMDSTKNCVESIQKLKPDLIFLDIIMPVLDGYSICQLLKSSDDTAFIPVIFLSGLDQVSDRLEGYACGAEDYITKPFDEEELCHKVDVALANAKQQKMWAKQYENNREQESVARSAIDQVFEMGALMSFHQKSGKCSDVGELGAEVVEVCNALGLDAVVQMQTHKGVRHTGCASDSLEAKLLFKSFSVGYDLHVRNRSVFHSSSLSILIKNMPQDDDIRYGRFKDHLQMLVNSASHCLEAIEYAAADKNNTDEADISDSSINDLDGLTTELSSLLDNMRIYSKGLPIETIAIKELERQIDLCVGYVNKIGQV